jgi:hypothetical protein
LPQSVRPWEADTAFLLFSFPFSSFFFPLFFETAKGSLNYILGVIGITFGWTVYGGAVSKITKWWKKRRIFKYKKTRETAFMTLISLVFGCLFASFWCFNSIMKVEALENIPDVENYFAGDLHAHSAFSIDPGGNPYPYTISQLAARARATNLRFLMMTEYAQNIGGETKGLHDTYEWQALENLCTDESGPDFLCLPGLEIPCEEWDGGTVPPPPFSDAMHYLAYNLNYAVGVEPRWGVWYPAVPDFDHYWYNDETVFDYVSDPEDKGFGNKGWGTIAHPHADHIGQGSDYDVYGGRGFAGMEVWNGGGSWLGAWKWDDALTEDWRHRGYAGTDTSENIGQLDNCWNWVYSPSLTEANLHRYLQEGRSCFSNGPFVAFEVRSGGTWYPMGSNYVGPNPVELYVKWQSWETFGPVTSIKLKRFSNFSSGGYQTVVTSTLINPDNYGGEAIFSLSLPSGVNVLRVWAETSEGKLGFANPIWVNPERADFGLTTLYEVHLDLDLYLNKGSMLAVKFYNYLNAYEGEEIIWSGAAPTRVTLLGDIPHPMGYGVKKVTLVATDSAGNVISTIVSFRVTKGDLWDRIIVILGSWPEAADKERDQLFAEIVDILGQWPEAP